MADILLVLAVISFAAGIICSSLLTASLISFFPPLFFLLVVLFFFIKNTNRRLAESLIIVVFFIVGIIHGQWAMTPSSSDQAIHRQIVNRQEVSLVGILKEAPAVSYEKTALLMAVEQIVTPDIIRPASGLALIRFKGYPPENLRPGDYFIARGFFEHPKRYATPGSFDYPAYLAARKIFVTGWLTSTAGIVKLSNSLPPDFVKKIRYGPEKIRQKINSFLTVLLPAGQAGLYKAILTGDRASVPPDVLENFKAIGCFHLLAISGLHMGLLALLIINLIYWLLKRSTWILLHTPAWKISVLLALPPLILYGFIAGFHIPVIRALIMTIVLAGAILFDRHMDLAASIALAALLILIITPASIFAASFQLSFAAVSGLAAFSPLLRQKLQAIKFSDNAGEKISKWIIFSIMTSMIALAGTAPLAIYHFNRLSLLSPISTLLIEPLLCFWSLTIGLLGSCFLFIEPQIAAFLFKIGSWGISGATITAEFLARLPCSSIWLSTPGPLELCCAYFFLVCLFYWRKHNLFRFAAAGFLLFLIIWPNWLRIQKIRSNEIIVSFLDVGQGSAVVMELSGGQTILLDGGGSRTVKFNVGESIIAPFLWQRRITHIDEVIISHPDSDHFNGLPFILERFKPEKLWVNGQGGNTLYDMVLDQAKKNGIKITIPGQNQVIRRQSCYTLLNLTGINQNRKYKELNDNNHSLIIRLDTPKISFLFPGDIEKEVEGIAVENNYNLAADIMLAPHHGSKTSSSEVFIKAVKPKEIVISASARKEGLFPAAKVIKRYREQHIFILTTGKDGTVSYRISPDGVSRNTFWGRS